MIPHLEAVVQQKPQSSEDDSLLLRDIRDLAFECLSPLKKAVAKEKPVKQPVLLLKTAWGGKSLDVDFRPPSSGGTVGETHGSMI